jgi:hypothetical protein
MQEGNNRSKLSLDLLHIIGSIRQLSDKFILFILKGAAIHFFIRNIWIDILFNFDHIESDL